MNVKNKGMIVGLLSAILWAINTIFLSKVMQKEALFLFPLFIAFSHDFFSAIFLYFNLKRLHYKMDILWKGIQRKNLYILIGASIFGGPLGMAGYLLSAKYLGPSYSSAISVLYPVLGAILGRMFFRESLTKNKKTAIGLSIFGIILLTFHFENILQYPEYKIGILFALFCIFGWALEGNVASYFMKEEGIPSEVAIFIRQMASSVFYFLFFIPWFDGIKHLHLLWFGSGNSIVILLLASLLGAISYLFWYKAIDILGSSIGMLLNSTYVVWIVLIDTVILRNHIGIKFIIALGMILVSVLILSREK